MPEVDRRTALGLLGGGAIGAALSPGPADAAATASPWTEEGAIRRGGGQIHYVSLGEDGPDEPLVLLPKLGGWVADWRRVAPLMSGRRVIALDPPGHGGSRMDGPVPYLQTVAESAALIMAALNELGVNRFALVGNSLGGCISVMMAAFWPGSVTRLGLLGVSMIGGMTRAEIDRAEREAAAPEFTSDGTPLPRSFAQTKKFGILDPRVNDEMNRSRAAAGPWVRASSRGVALADIPAYLPRIEAPTLILNSEGSNYRRYEEVARARIRDVRFETIAQSGAFTHQEQPAATAAVLTRFLAAQ